MSGRDPASTRLRFAIMCRGTRFQAWQAKCIQHLLRSGVAVPVSLIIEQVGTAAAGRPHTPKRLSTFLFRLYDRLWIRRRIKALREVDLAPDLGHLPKRVCAAPLNSVGLRELRDEDVAAIRADAPDFILQFAFDGVSGQILTAARFGIWTYDRDAEQYPGLTAFWEIYHGERAHSAALYRLTDPPGIGAIVLHSGSFKKQRSHARSISAMFFDGADWAARAARQIAATQRLGEDTVHAPLSRTASRVPTNGEFLLFLARRAAALAEGTFRHFFLLEYWSVGIVDETIESILTRGRPIAARWLANPVPGRYYADPFALPERPDAILIEEYDHVLGKGWISWISPSAENGQPQRIDAFDRSVHHSYPFVFCAEGAIYCIPECAEKRRVELYRAVRFPDRWQHEATLIEDFPALDSTVFVRDGRWWLFCTSSDEGGEHKLHAWHADTLLGPWRGHALNPLKCDVASSRPAGRPFVIGGDLYRPGQECSRTYGGAITVNRILKLTPTEFEEKSSGRIDPVADGRYGAGLHTVCPFGAKTIVDGKRFLFDLRAPYLRVKHVLARCFGMKHSNRTE